MENGFIVRKLKESDVEDLKKLSLNLIQSLANINSFFHGKIITRAVDIEEQVNDPSYCIFVAEHNKELIGYSEVKLDEKNAWFEAQEHALFTDIFIDKSKCEHLDCFNISFSLYKACENWAKEHHMKYLCADVYGENTRVRKILARLGFKEYKIKLVKDLTD